MNVAYFLIPKRDVVWVSIDESMRHAFQRMEQGGFTAIPLLDRAGSYCGTVTEGDLLRKLMSASGSASPETSDRVKLADVPLRAKITPVDVDANVEQLFERAIAQNFVPVQDSRGVFIGIVPRRRIIEHYLGTLRGTPSQ